MLARKEHQAVRMWCWLVLAGDAYFIVLLYLKFAPPFQYRTFSCEMITCIAPEFPI